MKGLLAVFVVTVVAISGGCKSTKKIQSAVAKKDTTHVPVVIDSASIANLKADSAKFIDEVYAKVESQRIDFKTFSAKVKVNYEGGDGKNYEFNAFIRIKKDSVIWVLANALLGIEAFRAMITPDSVKVVFKLDKTIQFRSLSYLQEVTHIPFDFKTLQDLIIGNPVYLDSNILYYRKDEKGISLLSIGQLFKNYITLNNGDYTLQHSKLDDVDLLRARTCDLTYGDYEQKGNIRFSTYRKISVAEKSKLDIQLSFKQLNFNEDLSFPFPIPKNYKRH